MRSSRLVSLAIAGAALAVPAVGLAASAVAPANGKFTGQPHYSYRSTPATGKLTITVAKHKISGVELVGALPPLDAKHSHGNACGAINDIASKGYTARGTVSRNGGFSYTFTQTYKHRGQVVSTDTIKLTGRFIDAKHAKGTFSDTSNWTAASAPGQAHCESGGVSFSVSHS